MIISEQWRELKNALEHACIDKYTFKTITNLVERLEVLEEFLFRSCGNRELSLMKFSDKIETGWDEYREKYLNENSDQKNETANRKTDNSHEGEST